MRRPRGGPVDEAARRRPRRRAEAARYPDPASPATPRPVPPTGRTTPGKGNSAPSLSAPSRRRRPAVAGRPRRGPRPRRTRTAVRPTRVPRRPRSRGQSTADGVEQRRRRVARINRNRTPRRACGLGQDTVWSRSAPGARRGGGRTCENAGSNTHCALAGTGGDARRTPETRGWAHMTSDWTTFGRVDEDCTVYVKTAAGERVVGSWQAGTPEEGLAHFARRYDGVVTEVSLIETRLTTGAGDAAHALARVKELRHELDEPHVVGDIDGLIERLDKLTAAAEAKVSEVHAARTAARVEAVARKTALVEEAEKLAADSTSWKSAGDRFKEILDEWKTIRGVDRKTDGELWKRYATARDAFARRRGAHFATLDASRKQAQGQKE